MMKLKTLDDHPEWKDRFCSLQKTILPEADSSSVTDPAAVAQILDHKSSVPAEAFFIETDTGEYCGRILLHGSAADKNTGHFSLFCLSGTPKHREDFLKLWPEIEAWFTYYGITKVLGQNLSTADLDVFQRLGFSIEEKRPEFVLISKHVARSPPVSSF